MIVITEQVALVGEEPPTGRPHMTPNEIPLPEPRLPPIIWRVISMIPE